MNDNQSFGAAANSKVSTINYVGPIPGAENPQSPCDRAHERLCRAQEQLKDVIGSLRESINPVLRDEPEQNTVEAVVAEEAPQSEIHGRFLVAARCTEDLVKRVERLLSQVTV